MGFSLLVSELIRYKKPLIGHNFFYDIGFLYYQFIDDFPQSYSTFKTLLHNCFPRVYDTEVITSSYKDKFPCSDLETIVKRATILNNDVVKFTFPSEFVNFEKEVAEYDAGFNAFCTGKVFAIIAKSIETKAINKDFISDNEPSLVQVKEDSFKDTKSKTEEDKDDMKKAKKRKNRQEVKHEVKKVIVDENEEKEKLMALIANFKGGPAINET